MTQEEKAKRYDEILEKFDVILNLNTVKESGTIFADDVRKICPELAESEDEKIRQWLIGYFNQYKDDGMEEYANGLKVDDIIAWLEKQGEQNPVGKIEPKFKVGDWVVNTITNKVEQVIELTDGEYICSGHLIVSFDAQHILRKWTIQDAKDGDVLYTSSTASNEIFIFKGLTTEEYIECYCSYDSEDKYCEGKIILLVILLLNTRPATKEQRDLLFQKMHESGYEWDAEKKELMKLRED